MKLTLAIVAAFVMLHVAGSDRADAQAYPRSPSAALEHGGSQRGWQNICREREITRRVGSNRLITFRAASCSPVWIGQLYFSNGRYYTDPTFLNPLY
ncbi:hypothetical protein NVS89_18155 [Ancylobacter sp. MQZ15Z-1]|uniref:Uncharacterized protein n=1 Tax=Ancylobacter mangrovi TaxID=2972472 RepID=A0A9X2PKL8_9HYPH|nr:hypothetical protein [Ancylobacter mangrovi]MCS0497012.1 hypothetical protein [Ancylobacter mangrovi]